MSKEDLFVNPQPPSNYVRPASNDDSGPLTNEDFRKLLMTPSAGSVRRETATTAAAKVELNSSKKKFANEAAERRREKKLYYASLMKEVKEREAELALKYRDRAKERRENKDAGADAVSETPSTTANFRAVGPSFSAEDNADRRRQIIEESKYLGGDLEHTHLVKGLDYALLQKVRAELEKELADDVDEHGDDDGGDQERPSVSVAKRSSLEPPTSAAGDEDEAEDEESGAGVKFKLKPKMLSKTDTAAIAAALSKSQGVPKLDHKKKDESGVFKSPAKPGTAAGAGDEDDAKTVTFKTKLGRSVYRVLFESQLPRVNELFMPHRMAYIVDLVDDDADVPITSIRSKVECPSTESMASMTTNDIVINKLTQILSYLRHSKKDAKKGKKRGDERPDGETASAELAFAKSQPLAKDDLGLYDDVGDYEPDLNKRGDKNAEEREARRRNYFGSTEDENDEELARAPSKEAATEFIRNINEKYAQKEVEPKKEEKEKKAAAVPGMSVKFDSDSYAECYPGTRAEEDVNIDSDEEADFTKMDLGSKKGPVNRWDFDSNEEYTDYMSNREAMPKAAFQYGLKMADGRKTRRIGTDNKTEKAKIDKEWTQISQIIDKRKSEGGGGGGGFKKPKF